MALHEVVDDFSYSFLAQFEKFEAIPTLQSCPSFRRDSLTRQGLFGKGRGGGERDLASRVFEQVAHAARRVDGAHDAVCGRDTPRLLVVRPECAKGGISFFKQLIPDRDWFPCDQIPWL